MRLEWILLLLTMSFCLHGMDVEQGSPRGRSSSRCDDEELAALAIELYFSDNDCKVISEIKTHLKERIHQLKEINGDGSEETIKRLESLRSLASKQQTMSRRERHKLKNSRDLNEFVNEMVIDALREYGEDKDRAIKYLEERAARKECHKRWAIGVALATLVVGTTTTLVVNFVD